MLNVGDRLFLECDVDISNYPIKLVMNMEKVSINSNIEYDDILLDEIGTKMLDATKNRKPNRNPSI